VINPLREVRATDVHATPCLLDVVALLSDMPAHDLLHDHVGTVVELLDGAYEVEFSDDEGTTYAELGRVAFWLSEPSAGSLRD
jgi:hypothetical protein